MLIQTNVQTQNIVLLVWPSAKA